MTGGIASDQLRSVVERVERVREEIAALNADVSEIYKEAKGNGFDVRALKEVIRKRAMDADKRSEAEAMFDLYWGALHNPSGPKVAPTHAGVHAQAAD